MEFPIRQYINYPSNNRGAGIKVLRLFYIIITLFPVPMN
nr:MAG TPA: hypothetical protein [Caudoviricetes sp.]